MEEKLSLAEQQTLLHLAREAMECGVRGIKLSSLDEESLSAHLREQAASFVTLTERGQLRGCIGTIEPGKDTLAEEIIANAINAATRDPRFSPVSAEELSQLRYSVDVLSAPEPATLVVDKPFVFFIRDKPTGAILFVGRVVDPR